MLLWEAHRDLAASLGDYIEISDPNVLIPDGVRFSKIARDSYLTRAMLEITRQVLSFIPGIPHKQASSILQSVLPTLIYKKEIIIGTDDVGWHTTLVNIGQNIRNQDINLYSIESSEEPEHNIPRLLWLISAYIKKSNRITPVPIRATYEAGAVLNFNIIHQTEPFICFDINSSLNSRTIIELYDNNGKVQNGDIITFHYVPLAISCDKLSNKDNLTVCKTQEQKMLSLALLYGLTDSQDIDASSYLPMEIGLTQQNK